MVQKVLHAVYREVRGLHQAAYILALFTIGSQLLALIRDRLLAHQFGAGIELDLYYTAFRIPDILYVLFASALSVYVLIPFISKRKEDGSSSHARELLSQVFSLFLIIYTVIALLAMVFASKIVFYFFPGFIEHTDTLVVLIRILLLQPLLLGVSSLFGVITQLEHRFILYAISPLIYNAGIIAGLVFLYPRIGVAGLAVGVVVGALGHVCVQLPFIMRSPLAPKFVFTYTWVDVRAVLESSVTRAVTLSLHQIVLFGLLGFASLMVVGSVSVFQFAFNLQSVPLAIIGVSYSVAAFPLLAQLYAEKKMQELSQNIITTIRHILFWSLPATALFIVIRAQFVRVVLGTGAFDWNDTRLTAAILAVFILSLASQAIHLLLVRALYAVENTKLPLYVTLFSSALALVLSTVFYSVIITHGEFYGFLQSIMRLEGVLGIEVLALPLGYSLALIVHSIILLFLAQKELHISIKELVHPFLQSFISALFAGYVAYTALNFFVTTFTTDTLVTILMQGSIAGFLGCAGYVLSQRLFRNAELLEIFKTLERRFTKSDIVVPQDEDALGL